MHLSSGSGGSDLVGLAAAQDGVQDVDAAAGEGDDGLARDMDQVETRLEQHRREQRSDAADPDSYARSAPLARRALLFLAPDSPA
jgi:hypothetical protein